MRVYQIRKNVGDERVDVGEPFSVRADAAEHCAALNAEPCKQHAADARAAYKQYQHQAAVHEALLAQGRRQGPFFEFTIKKFVPPFSVDEVEIARESVSTPESAETRLRETRPQRSRVITYVDHHA